MIGALHINHSFGLHEVLKDVSFELVTGSITGLIGPSGVGKSVLLKILGGVLTAQHGSVSFPVRPEGSSHAEDVSLMFQEGALFDSLTVFDNIAFPLVHGMVPSMILGKRRQREVHDKVEQILAHVGLSRAAEKMPSQLSGGMRRRVSLARALVCRPQILLLDDPTSGLDPVASGIIMNLIREVHDEYNPTTLIVSQDLRRLLPAVDNVLAMFDGTILYSGTMKELATHRNSPICEFISCRYDFGATEHGKNAGGNCD